MTSIFFLLCIPHNSHSKIWWHILTILLSTFFKMIKSICKWKPPPIIDRYLYLTYFEINLESWLTQGSLSTNPSLIVTPTDRWLSGILSKPAPRRPLNTTAGTITNITNPAWQSHNMTLIYTPTLTISARLSWCAVRLGWGRTKDYTAVLLSNCHEYAVIFLTVDQCLLHL